MSFLPEDNVLIHSLVIAACFLVLSRSAGYLVDGAVGIAGRLRIPKIIIGIVLVGFATTSPEFAVSLLASLRGLPEIALGNAVGSVIVDDALALSLGILIAPVAIRIDRRVLRSTGLFLAAISLLSFLLALNGIIGRLEGLLLIGTFGVYLA